jgi:hypothetical protein
METGFLNLAHSLAPTSPKINKKTKVNKRSNKFFFILA